MDIGVASVISSTIIGVAGIAVSLIYGYIPARRRANASSLLAIEKELTFQLGLTKWTVRKIILYQKTLNQND